MSIFSFFSKKAPVGPQGTDEQVEILQKQKAKRLKAEAYAKRQAEYEAFQMLIRAEADATAAAFQAVSESNNRLVAAKATMSDSIAALAATEEMIKAMEEEQRKLGLL